MSLPRFTGSGISGTYFFFKRSKQEKLGISGCPAGRPERQMPGQRRHKLALDLFPTSATASISLWRERLVREREESGSLKCYFLPYKEGRPSRRVGTAFQAALQAAPSAKCRASAATSLLYSSLERAIKSTGLSLRLCAYRYAASAICVRKIAAYYSSICCPPGSTWLHRSPRSLTGNREWGFRIGHPITVLQIIPIDDSRILSYH